MKLSFHSAVGALAALSLLSAIEAEAKIKIGKGVPAGLRDAYLNHAYKTKIEPKADEIAQFINNKGCAIKDGKATAVTKEKVIEVAKSTIKNIDVVIVPAYEFGKMTKGHVGAIAFGMSHTLRGVFGYEFPGKSTNPVIGLKEGAAGSIDIKATHYPMTEQEYGKWWEEDFKEKISGADLKSKYASYLDSAAQTSAHEIMHIIFTKFGNPALGISDKEMDQMQNLDTPVFMKTFQERDRKISLTHHAFLQPYYWAFQSQNNIEKFEYKPGAAAQCGGAGAPMLSSSLAEEKQSEAYKKLSAIEDPSFTNPVPTSLTGASAADKALSGAQSSGSSDPTLKMKSPTPSVYSAPPPSE